MVLLVDKLLELLMIYAGIREDCGMEVEAMLPVSVILKVLD